MGGSTNFMKLLFGGGMQAPQYQDQVFGNDEIMQYAKGYNKDMADAYRAEVLNQLRAGTFKDGNGVYQTLMNNNQRQAQMNAYNEQQASALAAQDQQQNQGWGG